MFINFIKGRSLSLEQLFLFLILLLLCLHWLLTFKLHVASFYYGYLLHNEFLFFINITFLCYFFFINSNNVDKENFLTTSAFPITQRLKARPQKAQTHYRTRITSRLLLRIKLRHTASQPPGWGCPCPSRSANRSARTSWPALPLVNTALPSMGAYTLFGNAYILEYEVSI